MRDSCLDCVIKHLGTAFTHFNEAVSSPSYAHHAGYGIGELQHAEEEVRRRDPRFAHKLAIIRRALTRDIGYWYVIPSDALMREAFYMAGKLPAQEVGANKQFPNQFPEAKDIEAMLNGYDNSHALEHFADLSTDEAETTLYVKENGHATTAAQ